MNFSSGAGLSERFVVSARLTLPLNIMVSLFGSTNVRNPEMHVVAILLTPAFRPRHTVNQLLLSELYVTPVSSSAQQYV